MIISTIVVMTVISTVLISVAVIVVMRPIIPTTAHPDEATVPMGPVTGSPDIIHTGAGRLNFHDGGRGNRTGIIDGGGSHDHHRRRHSDGHTKANIGTGR